MMNTPNVKHVKKCFIKPKYKVKESNQPHYLTPWDLVMLTLHYNQKGLLFAKPSQNFSFDKLFQSLEESLALTLVHFYPLAGQFSVLVNEDRHESIVFIDCNKGPGAQFIHATLDMTISDIVSPPYVPSVVQYLFDHNKGTIVNFDGHSRPLLSIQVTELIDGIFIGCSMNHAVADGTSLWHFWNVWSEIHRGDGSSLSILRPPVHNRWFPEGCGPALALPFIHENEFIHPYQPEAELKERIFHFSYESIAKLKAKANKETNSNNISSFQALTALIWRSIVRAKGLGPDTVTQCYLPANDRIRLDPPLPEEYFGNSQESVGTTITVSELLDHSLGSVASLLHESVVKHNDKAVRNFVKRWVEAPFVFNLHEVAESTSTFKIGGSPRFDIYSDKFKGLGKPVAARSGFAYKYPGKVAAYPGCQGAGSVDLEICLMPESMVALESDNEFVAAITSS